MAATMNFRNALNGFNRTDVVQFIQNQTSEHEKEVRLLREENARLQEALNAARAEAEEAKATLSSILTSSQNTAPQASAAGFGDQLLQDELPNPLDAPIPPVATVVSTAPADFDEMELAAYRRAEMTERMARERAVASVNRMKAIFAQADEKLTLTSQDMNTLLDSFRNDFEKMEQLLVTAQGIVNESSSGLKAASDICGEP